MKLRSAAYLSIAILLGIRPAVHAQPAATDTPVKPGKTTTSTTTTTNKKKSGTTATVEEKKDGATPSGGKLPEVVVSASRPIVGSVSDYDAEQITQKQATNFRELVREELDVSSVKSAGGSGSGINGSSLQSYNIRGLDGNRILIETDEIRQPEQYTFTGLYNIGRNYQDLELLKRVEILKSGASPLYGGDSIGGVVAYYTKDPGDYLTKDKPYYGAGKFAYDSSNNELAESVTAAFRTGCVDFLVIYSRRDGEETSTMGDYPANPLNYEQNSGLAKIVWTPNESHRFILTGEVNNYSSDSTLLNMYTPTRTFLQQGHDDNRYRVSFRHEFKADAVVFDEGHWQAYGQAASNTEKTYDKNSATVRYRHFDREYINNVVGGNVQFVKYLEDDCTSQRLTYGLDTSMTEIERNADGYTVALNGVESKTFSTFPMPYKELPDTSVFRFGMYVQDEVAFGEDKAVVVTPGLRVDYYNMDVQNNPEYLKITGKPPAGYDAWSFSPKLGVTGKITSEITGYGQYSQGFKAPSSDDLNGTFANTFGQYMVVPNAKLKGETSYSSEIGFRGNHPFLKWEVVGYYNYYQDFINSQTVVGMEGPVTVFQSTNIQNVHIFGTTLRTEVPFGYFNEKLDGLSLILGAGLSWGENMQTNEALDSIDPYKFTATLRYRQKTWGVDLINTFVAKKEEIPTTGGFQNFRPPSYNTVDLVAYYKPTANTTLTLGVYNMTDQQYWLWQDVRNITPNGSSPVAGVNQIDRYSQPGVSVRTSIGIQF